jgi:DNA-directed RNA polymerase subunit M/transcription elongation factor TFIIS
MSQATPRIGWSSKKKDFPLSISNACPHCGNRNNSHLEYDIETSEGTVRICQCTICRKKFRKIGAENRPQQKILEESALSFDSLPFAVILSFAQLCPICKESSRMTDYTAIKFNGKIQNVYRCHSCRNLYRA